ncbi:hypothetical protein AB205_0205570 [Aquarana catesbeiana]|uniref:Uncharacterized protein n=1 Tax=Aquarana catesbeiana TaxID=8400 RepID=A0A2G9RDI0_AQUCT|nr:hypothetical protein AB205_0205570 [Aquarana catesbeiana]
MYKAYCHFAISLSAVSGYRVGCSRHHHRLLFLLPRGQELEDHGILQKHGAPASFSHPRRREDAAECGGGGGG